MKHKRTIDDPFCIGYFVDNELQGWGEIAKIAIAQKKKVMKNRRG